MNENLERNKGREQHLVDELCADRRIFDHFGIIPESFEPVEWGSVIDTEYHIDAFARLTSGRLITLALRAKKWLKDFNQLSMTYTEINPHVGADFFLQAQIYLHQPPELVYLVDMTRFYELGLHLIPDVEPNDGGHDSAQTYCCYNYHTTLTPEGVIRGVWRP